MDPIVYFVPQILAITCQRIILFSVFQREILFGLLPHKHLSSPLASFTNNSVDELQPLLSDLYDSLTRLSETPNDFEPNRKVQHWLKKLNAMRAVDEIEDSDARQLIHDLDAAYTEFTRYLKRGS